jgi:HD superfamily phosphohydrolase
MTDYFNRKTDFEITLYKYLGAEVMRHEYIKRLDSVSFLGAFDYALKIPEKLRYTRYDHVLGVAYLTLKYCRNIMLSDTDTYVSVLAALIHDIGHGPFAHSTEFLQFLRAGGKYDFGHHSNLKLTKIEAFLKGCHKDFPERLRQEYDLENNLVQGIKKLATEIDFIIRGSPLLENENIKKMFYNPFCPDTFEGVNRALRSLNHVSNFEYLDPEELNNEVSINHKPLIVKSHKKPDKNHSVLKFHKLMKQLYEDVIDSPRYRAAEAMLTRAGEIAYAKQSLHFSRLKDSQFIKKVMGNEISNNLWNQLEKGELFIPLSLTDPQKFLIMDCFYRKRLSEGLNTQEAFKETEETLAKDLLISQKEYVIMHMFRSPVWNTNNIYFEQVDPGMWEIKWKPSEGVPPKNPNIEIYIPAIEEYEQLAFPYL